MTIQLFANPYDLSACGFYFVDADTYQKKIKTIKNDYGEQVEEFDIEFIEGAPLDAALFKALSIHQGNAATFIECAQAWCDTDKILAIIASAKLGYPFNIEQDMPDHHGITIYGVDTLKELAQEFVENGLFGEVPKELEFYIDYDAIARDLSVEHTETVIAGMPIVYRAI